MIKLFSRPQKAGRTKSNLDRNGHHHDDPLNPKMITGKLNYKVYRIIYERSYY